MNTVRLDDPAAFLDAARPLLMADEARHNLMLGVAATARDAPGIHPEYKGWLVLDGSEPVAAATRTPPHRLVLAEPRTHDALLLLVEAIDEEQLSVVGAQPEIDQFASAWQAKTGSVPRVVVRQGIYALEDVSPVPDAPGHMRQQRPEDTELLVEWVHAFEAEALHQLHGDDDRARRMIEHRLGADRAGMAIWEDEGRTVCVAGYGGETPNGIRIGPVYTPPELRGRGYATSLTAQLSAQLLAGGRRFCFLYTDLANPTSNAIYERIGYVRVCESAEIVFDA